jgi:hypothetical protein
LFPNIARYLRMLRDAPECFFGRRGQNLPEESDAEPLFEPSLFAGKSLVVRNFVMIEVMCQIGVIGIPTLPGIVETCLNVAGRKLIDCSFVETRA